MPVDQCVSAAREAEVPVLVCLRRSCNHVTEVGRLKAVTQNKAGDFVDVILLYILCSVYKCGVNLA
jgi:3-dehydroquinate synthase class II